MSNRAPASYALLSPGTAPTRRGAVARCPAAQSQGWRSAGCSCARSSHDQPAISGTAGLLIVDLTPTKRHPASMRTRRAVSMASRMLPPPPVDGLSRSSRDRPILGLAWRRASNRATTQASVHCICTAQATTHGRKTRPVAGEWCLGCVAAAAVPRRSVPSCPAVQLSHCPDSCLVRGPGCGARCCGRRSS